MAIKLVCTVPVGPYNRGDDVTDPAEIATYSETHSRHFVRVAVADQPADAKTTKATKATKKTDPEPGEKAAENPGETPTAEPPVAG